MSFLPFIPEQSLSRLATSTFLGLNETMHPTDGEWQRTRNLSTDHFPLLSPRRERTTVETTGEVQGLLVKDGIYAVEGGRLYANGAATDLQGLTQPVITKTQTAPVSPNEGEYWYSTAAEVCYQMRSGAWQKCAYPQKTMVGMGAYIVIFPDGAYYNTADSTDYGSINASYSTTGGVEVTICKEDGGSYGIPTAAPEAPENPADGDLWINTSLPTHALYQWSASSGEWVSIPTVYVRLTFSTVGELDGFAAGDGITLGGLAGAADLEALNGSHILHAVGGGGQENDYIIITGLVDASRIQSTETVTVERKAPQMDYVVEAGNRLWGCRYGHDGGQNINELYACKLGDFKNWQVYAGISTDSWAASVGSDGAWTGAISYLGYPTFFKRDRMHRISISSSGAHQVSDIACRGVAQGCNRSLAMVDEVLYYVSDAGVCAYDGSLPQTVSDKIPGIYTLGAAGSIGKKYYLSAMRSGAWKLLVLDTQYGLWLQEDETQAAAMAASREKLLGVVIGSGGAVTLTGLAGNAQDEPCADEWIAESGIQAYEYTDQKYLSRFDFRMQVPIGSYVKLELEYDSDGVWHDGGIVMGSGLRSFILPVRPRRCDHLRYRLTGRGDVRIYSVSRVLEVGSDG